MSEQFNFGENRQIGSDALEWAFIVAIAAKGMEKQSEALGHNKTYEIELKIDGIEFKFSEIIKRMMGEWDRCVEEKARELIKEKCYDLINKIDLLVEESI